MSTIRCLLAFPFLVLGLLVLELSGFIGGERFKLAVCAGYKAAKR